MDVLEIRRAVKRIGRSPEYLGLAGFIVFFEKGCRSSLIKRIARRYKREVKILFRLLKRRIENEMDRFPSPKARWELFSAVRKNLPAFSKFFDLNI